MISKNDQIHVLFCQALEHRHSNRTNEARALLEELLRQAPDYLPALTELTDLCLRTGDDERTIALCHQLLDRDPVDPYAKNLLGIVLRKQGDFAGAIQQFQDALKENPYNAHILYELGYTYHKQNKPDQAADCFRRASRNRNLGNQLQTLASQLASVVTPGAAAGALAHEINNPLAAIQLKLLKLIRYLETDQPVETDLIVAALREIDDQRVHIYNVIRHFRSLSSQEVLEPQAVALVDVIHKTLGLFDSQLSSRGIDHIFDPPDGSEIFLISGNDIELQVLFINLLANARDALTEAPPLEPEMPRIRVDVRALGDSELEVVFADNGPGISAELLPRIFDFQVTTKEHGSGLGLWLCEYIVGKTGGSLNVKSEPSEGAVFTLILPRRED